MFRRNYSSALLEEAVDQLASLPGVGRRTALRLALHLLDEPRENVEQFAGSLVRLRNDIRRCPVCGMISDDGVCPVCSDTRRDAATVCVVESLRDVLSIENTGQYNGLYHILGGIISPIDGVGPGDLNIQSLCDRLAQGRITEVVMALSTSMEGETTAYYLYKQISRFPVKVSAIARGVGFGDDLEYTDELTLGRSITNRQPFKP
ncbi:MAG: recombination protein RecR [Bacteroidales bacterium]|jgi:recombination protein RecR|nr:recombination protein RecR [Bacteroidales bacterium]